MASAERGGVELGARSPPSQPAACSEQDELLSAGITPARCDVAAQGARGGHDQGGLRWWWRSTLHPRRPHVKAVAWAATSALLLAVLALSIASMATKRGLHAPGAGGGDADALEAELAQHVASRVPEGVHLRIPPSARKPIVRKQPLANVSEGQRWLPLLDPCLNYTRWLKPAYHLTPEDGWMNDPNGMFQHYPGGPVHVFYQWRPQVPQWGSPWWGHVASRDLARWRRLAPALRPDQWYDADGVFSGSATLLPDGTPLLLYTATMNFSRWGFYFQQQAAAVPANLSDPLLVEWTKLAANPLAMEPPPGGTHAQFRDPTTAWPVQAQQLPGGGAAAAPSRQRGGGGGAGAGKLNASGVLVGGAQQRRSAGQGATARLPQVNGTWMTAVGALDDCVGAVSLFATDDLRRWSYVGSLFSQLSQNLTLYAQCLPEQRDWDPADADAQQQQGAPAGSRDFGGRCDQFGAECRMWEQPDWLTFDEHGVIALKYSDQSKGREPFAADFYVLGDAWRLNYSAAAQHLDGSDAWDATLQGARYQARLVDYGSVYASKTFRLQPDAAPSPPSSSAAASPPPTLGGSWAGGSESSGGGGGGSSNSTAQQGRLVLFGWVYEDSLGCGESVCGDGSPFILAAQRWQGALTLPRQVEYDAAARALRFFPLRETRALRAAGPPLADGTFFLGGAAGGGSPCGAAAATLLAGAPPAALGGDGAAASSRSPSGGRQVHVELRVALRPGSAAPGWSSGGFWVELRGVLLRRQGNGSSLADACGNGTGASGALERSVSIWLNGTAQPAPEAEAPLLVTGLRVQVDRTRAGGVTPAGVQGGEVPLPPDGLAVAGDVGGWPADDEEDRARSGSLLALDVYVDRSVWEVYAQRGAAVVTSRVYDTEPRGAGASPAPAAGGGQGCGDGDLLAREVERLGAWGFGMRGGGDVTVVVRARVHEMGGCWME